MTSIFNIRRVLTGEIMARPAAGDMRIATERDFVLAPMNAVSPDPAARLFPYGLDHWHGRSLYVEGVGVEEALNAPFFHLRARERARRVWSVPWEHGPICEVPPCAPIFLFSAGRCGTTLLKNIFRKAGVTAISEPDFYTQAAAIAARPRNVLIRPLIRAVTGALTRDLVATLGADPVTVIKLRAECCADPGVVLGPHGPSTRSIFMYRDFAPWAKSTARMRAFSPAELVERYLEVLKCWAMLERSTQCLAIRYETFLQDPAASCRRIGAFIGRDIGENAVAAGLAEDSQEGTPLSRDSLRDRHRDASEIDQALSLWQTHAMRRVVDRLGLPSAVT